MKLFSHPDKYLVDHLKEVANNCKRFIDDLTLFENDLCKKQILRDLAYIIGAFHDLGKATTYFQHYLLSDGHEITGPKNHALISALFSKEAASEYLGKTQLSADEKSLFAHLVFTAVKRHHGKLDNFGNELFIKAKCSELQIQISAFYEEEIQSIIAHFGDPLSLKYSFNDFKKYILSKAYLDDMPEFSLEFTEEDHFTKLPQQVKIEHYYFHQLLFSVLLLSDKTDVILDKTTHFEKDTISPDKVDEFRLRNGFTIPKSEIDERKNEAFYSSIENVSTVFKQDRHIYSLTLPTGLGKTITSFAVALEIKKALFFPFQRIIVSIPFTSIIDQNFEVYSQIAGTNNSNVILKHHHLAEPAYKINDEELDPGKSEFMIETWQSELVVTTFVQLLNSVFSNDKSLLMKLPNLANSIIILDEVQTVPYKYWQLIKNTFNVLGKMYNCYFILMSATQPLMFLPEEEIFEIVPDYKKYFRYFNRTRLINKTSTNISFASFIEEVGFYIQANQKKDILIILNTKNHSKKCFEELRMVADNETDDIFYLSTMITPYERKRIIGLIKEHSAKRKIIVSTQLIEAGVDISVHTVFRAIAPIDAIIQASGRANRYNEKPDQGEVYIYEIEEMRKATSMIYGADLIQKTKNVLNGIDTIEEKSYLDLIEGYFLEVRKQSESHLSVYLDGIASLNFKDVGEFSLIEERKAESMFLQLNLKAKDVWEQYVDIWEDPTLDIFQKKQEFAKIKSTFYDFVINVPVPYNKKTIDFDDEQIRGFYVSKLEKPSVFYSYDEDNLSQNTGYQEVSTLSF